MRRSMLILFVLVLSMPLPIVGGSGDEPSAEAHKALVRTYMERLINGGEWSAWPDVFGETVSFNGQPMDLDGMKTMAETFRSILPDLEMKIVGQIAEGDTVATRVTVSGTHSGDYMGLPASGKRVTFGGLAFDRIEDGRIVEMWHESGMWGALLMASDD